MCRITFPGLKIMYIILTTPVALILLVYSIYKWIMHQSDRQIQHGKSDPVLFTF